MPDIVSDDELNTLAAEYVLGTLDYEERRGASALLEVDPAFRGIVRIWERRFGDLHLMVEAVEPDPQLWERIRPKVPGIEQMALAIPSDTEEAAIVAAAAASAAEPAAAEATAVLSTEAPSASPEVASADTMVAELEAQIAAETSVATDPAKTPVATDPVEPPVATDPVEPPAAPDLVEPKPADAVPPAIAETELKLAELAALLPVAEHAAAGHAGETSPEQPAPEPLPEDGLHTHAPDLVPRGFVPPAPMSTRAPPAVVEVPVDRTGRGWIAATVMMGLVSVVLAGLIGAWRYFPERLPTSLRAYSVLNLPAPPASAPVPAPAPRPKLAPFDE